MAQHIPVECFKQKVMQRIAGNIRKDFKNTSGKRTSMKYDWDSHSSKFYAEHPDDEVYLATRYIGKGFVCGSNAGSFEIHFNRKKREVEKIYFVA